MLETNPFRNIPKDLDSEEDPFFKAFVLDYESDGKTPPRQPKDEQELEPTKDQLDLTATAEEKERYDNELTTVANIEITRKQERQIKEIITNLNKERQQNGLDHVELGKEINLHKIEIGGKTKVQLEQELKQADIKISDPAQSLLNSKDFIVQEQKEQNILIRLTVADLGFTQGATTEEIFKKAIELGMELCPAETGPQWRLQYQNQPMNEWVRIGMKQITDSGGNPGVFFLGRPTVGLWLDGSWAEPTRRWALGNSFVFRPASF